MRAHWPLLLAALIAAGALLWALEGTGLLPGTDPAPSATPSSPATPGPARRALLVAGAGGPFADGSGSLSGPGRGEGPGAEPWYLLDPPRRETADDSGRSGTAPATTVSRSADLLEPTGPGEPSGDNGDDEDPFADPYAIAGRVLDDTGAGVPGVEVTADLRRLLTVAVREDESAIETLRITLTDFAGAFRFAGLADGEYQLRAQPTERYTGTSARVRSGLGSVDLRVERKLGELQVYGVVASTEGGALDGVQILPLTQPTGAVLSDGTGFYELTLERTAGRDAFPIRFRRDGYGDLRQDLVPVEHQGLDALPLDVFLDPVEVFGRVAGTVTDQQGAPVPGERVKLFSRERNRSYTDITDANGRFAFAQIPSAADYRVEIRPEGGRYRDYTRTGLRVAAEDLDLPITLQPLQTATLAGRIVDADGNPVPYFTLWLRSRNAVRETLQLTSDADGLFLVEGVPAGPLSLESGASPLFEINGLYLHAGTEQETDLVVDWGDHVLRGQVVDASGHPIPGADVGLFWSLRDGLASSLSIRRTVADAGGRFSFSRLGPGPHRIRVGGLPGFEDLDVEHAVGDVGSEVLVQLKRPDW